MRGSEAGSDLKNRNRTGESRSKPQKLKLDQILFTFRSSFAFSRSQFESCKDRNKNDKDRSLLLFPLRAIVVRSLLNGSAWHWLTSKTVSATSFIESSRAPTLPRASSGPETGLALSLSLPFPPFPCTTRPSLTLWHTHSLPLTLPPTPFQTFLSLSLSLSLFILYIALDGVSIHSLPVTFSPQTISWAFFGCCCFFFSTFSGCWIAFQGVTRFHFSAADMKQPQDFHLLRFTSNYLKLVRYFVSSSSCFSGSVFFSAWLFLAQIEWGPSELLRTAFFQFH